jgi:hypothetical protein
MSTEARRTLVLALTFTASKSYYYFNPKRHGPEITPRSRTETVSDDPSADPRLRNPRTLRPKFKVGLKTRFYEQYKWVIWRMGSPPKI